MSRRLKVLISAYACEPNKGSEPEVGWQWALQMARFHDVTVLTRANNRPTIEPALELLRGKQPLPSFVYHDGSLFLLAIKRRFRAIKLYYLLWQRSAREVVEGLHQEHHFDLLHHVTFAAFRYPAAIWGHGVACVWGPVGGIESVPTPLLPWFHPKSLFREIARSAHNLLQSAPYYVLPKRAHATTVTLAATREMQRTFAKLGFAAQLMPTIGLNPRDIPHHPHVAQNGPLKILFVGNIITLKGIDLALCALKKSQTDATFTLIGDGDYLPAARHLAKRLGMENRVNFRGRLPRQEVLELYSEFDLFLFPSLHDTGGYAVIEAMCNELPVICLDCGGPSVAVRENAGIKVPLGWRSTVVANLAAAIRKYDENRSLLQEHGKNAREMVLRDYDWEMKGEQMNEVYRKTMSLSAGEENRLGARKNYSGLGGMTKILHGMISVKGALVAMLGLVLIGALGFASIGFLKNQADQIVNDTLPGLSFAGEANAYIAENSRTLLLLVTEDPNQRTELRKEINSLSERTSGYLTKYRNQVFTGEDRTNFMVLIQSRQEYIAIRNHVIELSDAGRQKEALLEFNRSLLPLHARVKKAGDKLFEFNMRQGEIRGKKIMAICTVTQIVVAVIGVAVFLLGFFLGLFK